MPDAQVIPTNQEISSLENVQIQSHCSELEQVFRGHLNRTIELKLWDGNLTETIGNQPPKERCLNFRAKILDTRPFEDTLLIRVQTGITTGPWGAVDSWLDAKLVHSVNGLPIKSAVT